MKITMLAPPLANPRRTTLAHLKDTGFLGPQPAAEPWPAAEPAPPATANPSRVVLAAEESSV